MCSVEKERMEDSELRIQIANGDYPERRLWLELPIKDDPTMAKTIGRLASLMNPGQTEADLTVGVCGTEVLPGEIYKG